MSEGSRKSRVLCVDDDPLLLQGLELHLVGHVELRTATSGAEALSLMAQEEAFDVVISDMRMPGMDGATFLGLVRERAPDTVRMLLTGHAETEAAIASVNQGGIFRYLVKPCTPSELREAVEAAIDEHWLLTADRQILEQQLRTLTNKLVRAEKTIAELREKLAAQTTDPTPHLRSHGQRR